MNTNWRFYKMNNLTILQLYSKYLPMGCKDALLTEPLLKNCTVKCLTFEENTKLPYNDTFCLLTALALFFHGNQRPKEETSKLPIFFIKRKDGLGPNHFQSVHFTNLLLIQSLLMLNLLLKDVEIIDGGTIVEELGRPSVQRYEKCAVIEIWQPYLPCHE